MNKNMKKLVSESLNEFKAGVPQIELKSEFFKWWDKMLQENPDEDWEWLVSELVNDEYSSDEEMVEHFIDSGGITPDIAMELVNHRTGFLNYGLDIHV